MKLVIFFGVLFGSAAAWSAPQVHCSAMIHIYSNPAIPSGIKNYLAETLNQQWTAITGHDMSKLDEIQLYVACLNSPAMPIEQIIQKVIGHESQHQIVER